MGDLDPHLIHGSLDPHELASRAPSQSVQSFMHNSPICHAMWNVWSKRPHLCTTCMRYGLQTDHFIFCFKVWTWIFKMYMFMWSLFIFMSTLWQSRPNEAGLNCPCVCTYVPPSTKRFFHFYDIWYVGRGRWVMHDGMQYDPIHSQRQGYEPLEIWPFSEAISSVIYNGSWQLTTDS